MPCGLRNPYNFRQNDQVKFPIASSPRASSHPSPSGNQIINVVVPTDVAVQDDTVNVFTKVLSS